MQRFFNSLQLNDFACRLLLMAKKKQVEVSERMAEIGAKGGRTTKRRKGKAFYSKIAALSHPRKHYTPGTGRPRKKKTESQ